MFSQETFFIAFEGLDGSGKDTQLHRLIDYIKSSDNELFGDKYSNVWITRQPTKITKSGIDMSEKLKQKDMSKEDATNGFIQDRIEHSFIIRDMLKHSFVLTSRCDMSTLIYQSSQGMSLEELYEKHNYGNLGTQIPDITLVFKVSPEVGLKRIQSHRQDVPIECFENYDFLKECEKQEKIVIDYVKNRDGRVVIEIDSEQSIDDVTKDMVLKLEEWFKNEKKR